MDTAKRIQLIRIIEKMEKDPGFSEKLGIKNKSVLKPVNEQKKRRSGYEAYCN